MFDLADVLTGVSNLDTARKQLEYIPRDRIDPDPNNFYSLDGIDTLADNIQLCGLQQPIVVRPDDGERYVVVSGHRRRAAIELLASESPEQWAEIPCMVERDAASPELQQLRLIYANADTRIKTGSEIAREAEQVEELLYQLKEQGYEFPGRMRDHVAQAVKASRSKLARLKLIRKNLIQPFAQLWEDGSLRDSVAYALAQADQPRQRLIWDYQTACGEKTFRCSEGWVENLLREIANAEEVCGNLHCEAQGLNTCPHLSTRKEAAASLSQYSALCCRGCCRDCWNLKDCRFSCPPAEDARKALREKAQSQRKQEKAEQAAREAPERELLRTCYQRIGALRAARAISAEDFLRTSSNYVITRDVEALPKLESGTVSLNDRLPGGLWVAEGKRLAAVADLLGCSVDYLLCRTDVPATSGNVPNLDTGWRTGTPDSPGEYAVIGMEPGSANQMLERWRWDGSKWTAYGTPISDFGFSVKCWIPLPPNTAEV